MNKVMSLLFIALVFCVSIPAYANMTLNFHGITVNDIADVATGQAQLSVDVTGQGVGDNQVMFEFHNAGPLACSITDIYFDDGTLLGLAYLFDRDDPFGGAYGDSGVDFSQGASPGNLPSGNNADPPFVAIKAFTFDSDPKGTMANGINPGESLGIVMNLQGTQTSDDVEDELLTGELRIGIHVQGFDGDGSESFVNNPPGDPHWPPPPTVPAPGALLLGSMGAGFVGWLRRRRTL